MTTIEKNKLFANFLEFAPCKVRRQDGKPYDYNLPDGFELILEVETTIESNWCEILMEQDFCMVENLKFHTDWNWLMKVVDKIENIQIKDLYFNFNINGLYVDIISSDTCEIVSTNFPSKLETVYEACVQFINWYNLNKDEKTNN